MKKKKIKSQSNSMIKAMQRVVRKEKEMSQMKLNMIFFTNLKI
jgi:hypothetical protein